MKNEKPRKQPSRLYWISMTLNVVLVVTVAGIMTNRVAISMEPMQIASAPQAQMMPASLPLNASTVFEGQ